MAYNFNPRQKQRRTMKFDQYQRLGMIKWSMVPIGQIDINRKYMTVCAPTYKLFNECLKRTLFNREQCKPDEEQVINCEKVNDLYQAQNKLAILKSYKKKKFKKEDNVEKPEVIHDQD